MNIEKEAFYLANDAHFGQVRKAEPNKPYIVHPVHVASLLKEYRFDSNVVAAGFLHDVVEDTKYRQEDIQYQFGRDISSLIEKSSQPDKSMSWELRKMQAIEDIKYQDLRHKGLMCADKISNLDDLRILFGKLERYDFSAFRRGYEKQKWYYEEIYQSLIFGGFENHPMFLYLRQLIDEVFHSEQSFHYSLLEYQKQELAKLKVILKMMKAYGNFDQIFCPVFALSMNKKQDKILHKIIITSKKMKMDGM